MTPATTPATQSSIAPFRYLLASSVGQLPGGVLFQIGRAIPLIIDAVSFAASALLLTRLPAQRAARTVPAHLLGRTMGAYRLLAWGTMPLGAGAGMVLLLGLSLAPVVCGDARLASPAGDDG